MSGGPDTIDLSYILPDDGRVIHIPTNKQGCCPWPWSWVVLEEETVVLGPDLGVGAQVLLRSLVSFSIRGSTDSQ